MPKKKMPNPADFEAWVHSSKTGETTKFQIPDSSEIRKSERDRWEALPQKQRETLIAAGVLALKDMQDFVRSMRDLRAHITQHGDEWPAPIHLWWGMWYRNQLRQHGIEDQSLPTGNLDDYYVRIVEEALPIIEREWTEGKI